MISLLIGYRGDDGPRDEIFGWVLKWWKLHYPEAQICIGRNFDEPFHRGKARNDAFEEATGDILIVADADTVPTVYGVDMAIEEILEGRAPWVLPYGQERYYNLTEAATRHVLNGPVMEIPEPPVPELWDHKLTSWAGCLVMPRSAWMAVQGYDERFVGWGGEDNAFQIVLDVLHGPHTRIDSYVCHLWHPRGDADFSQPNWPHNRKLLDLYKGAANVEEMRRARFG